MTLALADRELDRLAALRDGEEVGDDCDGGGFAACSVTGEDDVAAEAAADDDHVLRAVRPGDGRGERAPAWARRGRGRSCPSSCARETWRMVQLSSFA